MACVNISWAETQMVLFSRRLAPAWPLLSCISYVAVTIHIAVGSSLKVIMPVSTSFILLLW